MDLDSCFSPAAARALPLDSVERAVAVLSLRNLWHTVFDTCPTLLAAAPPDGRAILDPFLDEVVTRDCTMNWTLHVHLLHWLTRSADFGRLATERVIEELLAAAAARWSVANTNAGSLSFNEKTIVLHSPLRPLIAVGAAKSVDVISRPRIVVLKLRMQPNVDSAVYSVSTRPHTWNTDQWMPIPP